MRTSAAVCCCLIGCWLVVASAPAQSGEGPKPRRAMIGKRIPDFTINSVDGKRLRLYSLKEHKAIVLVFLSFDCPVSNSYAKPLADIHREFHDYGVTLIGLTTNEDQSRQEVRQLAREYGIPFPVAIDRDLTIANILKADVTPEVFVLDGNYVLRYRGRIDNTYFARLKRNYEVSCHDLKQVLGELMSGRPVSVASTEAIGCMIQRDLGKIAADGPVTFYRDVLPILRRRCQQCHRPGGIGQFSLLSFRQAVTWAEDIKRFTGNRYMPPWKAVRGGPFRHDRRMTAHEIRTLARWVKTGKPKGKSNNPMPIVETPLPEWTHGRPDLVLDLPEFELGPDGHDTFRCFVVPTRFKTDKFISAVDLLPGNPRVVHHAFFFIDTKKRGRALEKAEKEGRNNLNTHHRNEVILDKGPGYSVDMGIGFEPDGWLGGWAAHLPPTPAPEGYGYYLPKGADLIVQVHYHRTGRTEHDQSRVGIYFARGRQLRRLQSGTVLGGNRSGNKPGAFIIPPGKKNVRLVGRAVAQADFSLHSITPKMYLLGRRMTVTLKNPGSPRRVLLGIDDWEYPWQQVYHFARAVAVKKGAEILLEAFYDNTLDNPYNPYRPPQAVRHPAQPPQEMCRVILEGVSTSPGERLPLQHQ